MKWFYLGLMFFLGWPSINYGQVDVDLEWAKSMGGPSWQEALDMTVDDQGNVYTTGFFSGSTDFDPGPRSYTVSSAGSGDIFIQKLNRRGEFVWAKTFGGRKYDQGRSIKIGASGSIYLTGWFHGKVDFDPGLGIYNLDTKDERYRSGFVQKLDSNGGFVWAAMMGNEGNSITITPSEDLYVTGVFSDTLDFDPSSDTFYLTPHDTRYQNAFITKLNSVGQLKWAKAIDQLAMGAAITSDNRENVYITGYFAYTADFDLGRDTFNLTSNGSVDVFVLKMDKKGDFIWARSFGGDDTDKATHIMVNAQGEVIVTGGYQEKADFNPGGGVYYLKSNGSYDAFIEKLDSNGGFIWAQSIGGPSRDFIESVSTDTLGNVYAAGFFTDSADCDPGVNELILKSKGGRDVLVQKLDRSGNLIWAKSTGSAATDMATAVALGSSGNVHMVGWYYAKVDFDLSTDTFHLVSADQNDMFVQKSGQCAQNGEDVVVSCDSFKWMDGKTYRENTRSATYMLSTSNGCDSVVALNLTINKFKTGFDQVLACDSFHWIDGNTYTSSTRTPTYTLTSVQGCDSIVTLDLRIRTPTVTKDKVVACESYQWLDGITYLTDNDSAVFIKQNSGGCGSIFELDLKINRTSKSVDSVVACQSYQWIDGKTYMTSNNWSTYTLTNVRGCDSVVTLNLQMKLVDTSLNVLGSTLTANEHDATYQWLDCKRGYSTIRGDTSRVLSSRISGTYAVEITKDGCVDTSGCIAVLATQAHFIHAELEKVSIFPNPSSGKVTIDPGRLSGLTVRVLAVGGQLVYETKNVDSSIQCADLIPGFYVVEVLAQGVTKQFKLVMN